MGLLDVACTVAAIILFGAAVIGGGIVLKDWFIAFWTSSPDTSQILYVVGTLIILGAILWGAIQLIAGLRLHFVEILDSRHILAKRRGSLKDELRKKKGRIWLSFNNSMLGLHDSIWNSDIIVEKLLLSYPNTECSTRITAKLTSKALGKGTQVAWYKGAVGGNMVIIADKKVLSLNRGVWKVFFRVGSKGFVRYGLSNSCIDVFDEPSVVIKYNGNPEVYETLVYSYEKMWDASEKITMEMIQEMVKDSPK